MDKNDSLYWPITLLSHACTSKLIERADDRDADASIPYGHRYDAYFQSGSMVIRIASMGKPTSKEPGDVAVLSVFDISTPDSRRDNRPVITMESVSVPWFDFQTPLQIYPQTDLRQFDPKLLYTLADAINGGMRTDKTRFETLTTSPVTIPA